MVRDWSGQLSPKYQARGRLRVLHIITGLSTGGAERALYNVLSGGLQNAIDNFVLSLRDEGTFGPVLRDQGVVVASLNIKHLFSGPSASKHLREVLKSFSPDVIQGWMYHGNLVASLAGRLTKNNSAVAWNIRHSLYDLSREKFLTRQVIRSNRFFSSGPRAIVYNSKASRLLHENFGFFSENGRVIFNGFDLERLKPDRNRRNIIRQYLGIDESQRVIGHVARLHPVKDHKLFLQAAVRISYRVPEVKFLLIGREVNLNHPALQGVVPNELVKRFICLGERHDVPELMQAMDIYCQSSWSEAFPNVLGEAMATGVPCVTTDVGESADIVSNTGSIVPPSNLEALVNGLMTMLKRDRIEMARLSKVARLRIETNYSLPLAVAKYVDLYESLSRRAQLAKPNTNG